MTASVDVRLELDAGLGHGPPIREAEHLVAAAVGEDRPPPAREPVEPAEPPNQRVARPQVEVIGVAEDDLRAGVLEVLVRQRLDGTLRAHRHERGRVDRTVRGLEAPAPRCPVKVRDGEGERHLWGARYNVHGTRY